MKKLFLAAFLFIILWSCGEDPTSQRISETAPVPKVIYHEVSGATFKHTYLHEYDSDGRLIKRTGVRQGRPYDDYLTYEYKSNSVMEIFKDDGGWTNDTTIYTLNADGLAISKTRPRRLGKTTYAYDSDGFLIEEISTEQSLFGGDRIEKITFKISDGNIVSQTSVVNNNSPTTDLYLYFFDNQNTLGHHNFGIFFLGKDSKNIYKRGDRFGCTEEQTHEYTFDSRGYAIQDIETYPNANGTPGTPQTNTHTFQD